MSGLKATLLPDLPFTNFVLENDTVGPSGVLNKRIQKKRMKTAAYMFFSAAFIGLCAMMTSFITGILLVYHKENPADYTAGSISLFRGIAAAVAAGFCHYTLSSYRGEWALLDWINAPFRTKFGLGWGFLATLIYWAASLLGNFAGSGIVYAMQLDNAVSFAGAPVVDTDAIGRPFVSEFIGSIILTWVHFTVITRTYAAAPTQGHAHLIGALAEGAAEALCVFVAFKYSRGIFGFLYATSSFVIGGYHPENLWIWFVAPVAGTIGGFLLHLLTTADWDKLLRYRELITKGE